MLGKRKYQLSEADFEYLYELATEYADKNAYDGRGVLLLCRSLFPNNNKIKVGNSTGSFYL